MVFLSLEKSVIYVLVERNIMLCQNETTSSLLNRLDTREERADLMARVENINKTLAMFESTAPKARKPRTPKAPSQTPPAEGEKGGA